MKVWVDEPTVDGDRVLFSWRQSEPNPFQRANEFYFRYEGIELKHFSSLLLYEIFLSMQLRIFVSYDRNIDLIFPEPIPARSIEFWRAFHGGDAIEIGPIADVERYEPMVSVPPTPKRRAAIFHGGGKDSVLATGMMTEIFGDDQVVLIQYVAPITPTDGAMSMHARRQKRFMLDPIKRVRGVATQNVFTNYLQNLNEAGIKHRPHRQFYTAGALPALLAWGNEFSSFGDTRTDFPVFLQDGGKRHYTFAGSRPEVLQPQSAHYQRVLGFDHQLNDVSFGFSTNQDQVLLIKRYPELLPATVPCTNGNSSERFCHRCYKCMIWLVFGLGAGHIDPDMDYDRMLRENEWILKLLAYAKSGVELSYYGNAPWLDGSMKVPHIYQPVCHSLATVDPEQLGNRIGSQARTNLYILIALLGNRTFDIHQVVAKEIFDFAGGPLMQSVAKIATEHHPMVERLPEPWIHGDRLALIDYTTRMPTRMDHLAYLQS